MSDITVLIHTRNSERTLPRLLQSVAWAKHIIAVDMVSTDRTKEILKQYGAQIYKLDEQPWNDSLRNRFLSVPETPWTLVLDSDEYLSDDADQLLRNMISSAADGDLAFSLPRYNWCFGKVLEGPRWYPDRQVRLFRTKSLVYTARHHSPPSLVSDTGRIIEPNTADAPHIHHDHYSTIEEFIRTQVRYSLTDDYGHELDWSDYTYQAIEGVLEARNALSSEERATGIILAWDKILRALIHWEKRGRIDRIPEAFGWAFGVRTTADNLPLEGEELVRELRDQLAVAEHRIEKMTTTFSWRVTAPLRLLGMLKAKKKQ
jgi:glycosyltransferase involved in cell wall biosynthesis